VTGENYFDLPYIVFDFNRGKFTIINHPNFYLNELDENTFQLELHFRYYYSEEAKEKVAKDNGKTINLRQQDWWAIDQLNKVCELFN